MPKYSEQDVEAVRILAREGWSQEKIAQESGMSVSQVRRIIKGLSRRPQEVVEPISSQPPISPQELIDSQLELLKKLDTKEKEDDPIIIPSNPYY